MAAGVPEITCERMKYTELNLCESINMYDVSHLNLHGPEFKALSMYNRQK